MKSTTKKRVVLVIVDGFGIAEDSPGNAVTLANTPTWQYLQEVYPMQPVHASGNHVGLPDGVMGNSEVGHLTIGTGRITYQSLERINQAIKRGELPEKEEIQLLKDHLKQNSGRIHLMGLLSDGQVHSDQKHLHALIDIFAPVAKEVLVHGFTDGRDTPIDSGVGYVKELLKHIEQYDNTSLATIIGRYYVMDRDQKWDRTQLAYNALVNREGETTSDIVSKMQERYDEEEYDEFLKPIIVNCEGSIENGDAVLFFNFRPDRARQITQAINYEVDFETKQFDNLCYVTMTSYDDDWDLPVVFDTAKIRNSLAEILSANQVKQAHIAETEKYAHVTYFLNGGIENEFPLEERFLIPSPKIATYDLQPEMSTPGIVEKTVEVISSEEYPFVVINIACPDMVGHTGVIDAAVSAVETMDQAFKSIYEACKSHDYIMAITADHGNAEKMLEGEEVHTAHTTNKVPFLVADTTISLGENGGLKNVAPTILELMGITIPDDMDGGSLIVS